MSPSPDSQNHPEPPPHEPARAARTSETDKKLVVARVSSTEVCPPAVRRRQGLFARFAHTTARLMGTSGAFFVALAVIAVWAASGPFFHYSDTWQLVINTSTTIITFLMVFVIQHTQNRDTETLRLKLDELIRASAASNDFIDLEDLDDDQLQALHLEFQRLREESTERRSKRIEKGRAAATAEE